MPDVTQRTARGDCPRWFDGGVGRQLVHSSDSLRPVDPRQTLLSELLAGTVLAGSVVAVGRQLGQSSDSLEPVDL
ncbi:MAG UNVERIFIED_CONTAM: hypothetical protein LVR18_00285 [Planctomycetaceae bacterium]